MLLPSAHARGRYAYSGPFIRTNHIFGDEVTPCRTTYTNDYANTEYLHKPHPLHGRLRDISADERDNDTTPRLPPIDLEQVSFSADRKKMLQKTNFKFGNDGPTRRTAYADFARIDNSAFRYQRPCPPPTLAKMLPDPMTCCLYPGRSTIRSDYTYFGPDIAEVVHSDRLANLGLVKSTHVSDSVGHTLRQAIPPRLLSRSMVDYRPPKERIKGCITALVRQTIAPQMRIDSIWPSVNGFGTSNNSNTEVRENYTWHFPDKVERFERGHMNKVR